MLTLTNDEKRGNSYQRNNNDLSKTMYFSPLSFSIIPNYQIVFFNRIFEYLFLWFILKKPPKDKKKRKICIFTQQNFSFLSTNFDFFFLFHTHMNHSIFHSKGSLQEQFYFLGKKMNRV